jgi:hypothetical protein
MEPKGELAQKRILPLVISRSVRRGEVDPLDGFVGFMCLLLVLLRAFCWINEISGTVLAFDAECC